MVHSNDFGFPTTSDAAVLHGATQIIGGAINGYRAAFSFVLFEFINAGETIDFAINWAPTAVTGAIQPVWTLRLDRPQKSRWVILILTAVLIARYSPPPYGHSSTRSPTAFYDLNRDGNVDIADARFLALHFNNPGGAPCN